MTTASNIILLDQLTQSIHPEWKNFFILYHTKLLETVRSIDWTGTDVLPAKPNIFKVFEMNPKDIKVVILGQDPYHGMNQATGLSFSVNKLSSVDKSIRLESYNDTIIKIYNCSDENNQLDITSDCKYSKTINNHQSIPTNSPTPMPPNPKPNLSTLEIVLIVILSVILVGGIIGIAFLIKNKCFNCNKNMVFTKQFL
jgi:hypothetical protein